MEDFDALRTQLTAGTTVMLIDNPHVHCLPTPEMVSAGHIERLFHSPSVSFDISEWEPGSYAVRVKGRG